MSQHESSTSFRSRSARPRRLLVGSSLMTALVGFTIASCSRLESTSGDGGAPSTNGQSGSSSDMSSGSGSGAASGAGQGSGAPGPTSGSASGSGVTSGSGSGMPTSGSAGSSGGGSSSGSGEVVVDAAVPVEAAQMACGDTVYSDAYTPGYSITATATAAAQALIAKMSTTQMANQMRGTSPGTAANANFSDTFRTPDDTTLGIKGFQFRDGPRGVNQQEQLPAGENGYSTAFPVPSGRGASFDLALELQIGDAVGDETLASNNTMILAPVINILRHPAWGRAQESYGEDSYLLGRMGSAFTVGAQHFIPACAKHYAANNIEDGRANLNATIDDETLHEVYGRHFEMVIQDGGVACIMAAYNLVNMTKCTENSVLLTQMLRTTFGFQGMVLTDWWALPPGSIPPGEASTSTAALDSTCSMALSAGLDMEVPWALNYAEIESLVGTQITQAQVTTAATRIVETKERFNVAAMTGFGAKKPTSTFDTSTGSVSNPAHVQLAYQSAIEGMVLLKNANNTLPISKTTVKSIAVVGASVTYSVSTQTGTQTLDFPTNVRLGDMGSSRVFSDPTQSTSPFQGITTAAGSGITVTHGNTVADAMSADFVVVIAGLTPYDEGEEYTNAGDRKSFALDAKQTGADATVQNDLITAVAALNKPMVVVLEGGSVIDMPWLSSVPAVVMAWYPGLDGGHALGDLLFANPIASGPNMGTPASFAGKLPVTWPQNPGFGPPNEPTFNAGSTTVMGYYLGYRWFENQSVTPQYYFGDGLHYTTFSYSNLFVPCSTVTTKGVVNVTVDITNTGKVASDETAFLFVGYPNSKVTNRQSKNYKELKGFYRTPTAVQPGQTVNVTIPLRVSDLKYWDATNKVWAWETGAVQVYVGPSYENLMLSDMLTIGN
jgi:beta-glucosidase